MELYQLKSFVTIAREGNLTRAAEVLHLSQSALSSQLKLLEEELGLRLFERTARGMRLTERGESLLENAHDVLDAAGRLRERALSLNRRSGASVTLGLHADPSFLRVGAINRRLTLLNSGLGVNFQLSQTISTVRALRQGEIDLGFHYGDLHEAQLEGATLAHIRLCVVVPTDLASPEGISSWSHLVELPWIWVDKHCPLYVALLDRLDEQWLIPNHSVTTTDEQVVRELVAAGQGVAVMREDEARPLVAAGRALIWEPGWMNIPLRLSWLRERRDERGVSAAIEAVRHVWHDDSGELGDKYWV